MNFDLSKRELELIHKGLIHLNCDNDLWITFLHPKAEKINEINQESLEVSELQKKLKIKEV